MNQFQGQLIFSDGQTMAEKRFGVNTAPAPQKVSIEEFEKGKRKKKYTQGTCPYSDTWFVKGGRCGWGNECGQCSDNM